MHLFCFYLAVKRLEERESMLQVAHLHDNKKTAVQPFTDPDGKHDLQSGAKDKNFKVHKRRQSPKQ